jgi:hypothetical protein
MKICGWQPNKTLNYILCFYFISNNSLNPSLCIKVFKKIFNPHQVPKLHPKSFTSKINLKIKLINFFNPIQQISHHHHALFNLCPSLSNEDAHISKLIKHQISSNLTKNAFESCYFIHLNQNNVLKIISFIKIYKGFD